MPGQSWNYFTFMQPDWSAESLPAEKLLNAGTQLDLAQFGFSDSQTLTLAAGAVTAGSNKTLTLTQPLTDSIPNGIILNFCAGEFFTLTTKGTKGETTLTGDLAADLEGGETTTFKGISGHISVASGALQGRTYTERANGAGFGPAVATDDEIFIVAFQVDRAEIDAGVTFVRHQTLIYENKLPGWSGFDATMQAKVRSLYQTIISA